MKHPGLLSALAVLLTLTALSAPAMASERHRAKLMEGVQETPAVITGASGTFDMDIAKGDVSFTFTLTYEGIENGTVTQAHIHVGQPNVAGGIVIFLCTNLAPPAGVPVPPPCPTGGGTVTGTRTAADVLPQTTQGVSAGEFSAVLTAIREGVAYANVHSTGSPAGEIRGQIK
jgi:CHRD domain-containing protein